MAQNVNSPENLAIYSLLVESVAIPSGAGQYDLGVGLTSAGIPPAAAGAFGIGTVHFVNEPVQPQHIRYVAVATKGIGIAKLAATQVVPLDAPLTVVAATGEFKVGVVGTDYIYGRALDSSTGSAAGVNHYVRIRYN